MNEKTKKKRKEKEKVEDTILKVTLETYYAIPMIDKERTMINGWPLDVVMQEWFENHPIDTRHASRDYHRVGNAVKIVKVEKVDNIDI